MNSAIADPALFPLARLPHVLCVDDEPQVLEGLRDVLRRTFRVKVAQSGPEGLELLRQEAHGFAVVISDMRMPGMPGSVFLRDAKRVAPLAVRILLTGYADTEAAIRAVNDGQIFRFLTKPCNRDELLRACTGALLQHRVLAAERVVLEQTLHGSVKALTDVLALSSPAAFGRGARVKRALGRFAARAGCSDIWELEVAAMLAQMGAVTLPEATAERLYAGVPLSEAEQAMVDRVPATSERLIASIPRLEGVQEILRHCRRRADSVEADGALPAGAAMLRIATDFDELEAKGLRAEDALDAMRGRAGTYEPALLDAFARTLHADPYPVRVRDVPLAGLAVGARLAGDLRSRHGRLIMSRGYVVTTELVERLRNLPDGDIHEPVRIEDGEAPG